MSSASGHFYIGSRSFNGDPTLDHYTGSGVWPRQCRRNSIPLSKSILGVFETRAEACEIERKLIQENIHDPLCMNLVASSSVPSVSRNPQNSQLPAFRHLIMSEIWETSIKARLIYIHLLARCGINGISVKVMAHFERISIEDCWEALRELMGANPKNLPTVSIEGNIIKLN